MARLVARSLLMFVTAVAALYAVAILGGVFLARLGQPVWPASVAAFGSALLLSRFVWIQSDVPARTLVASMLFGAIVTGAIGFTLGFFGPVLLRPGTNQGALLGLFVTGPAGFVLGGLGGWLVWARRRGTACSARV